MIRLNNVSKYFPTPGGRKYVLKSVSLDLPEFVNIGVLGLNGSGKSTLLRIIGGIDYPSSGSLEIKGSISWPMGLAGGVQESLTGKQNAQFVCRIYGDSEKAIREKLAFIKAFSELDDYFEMPVKTYSSGMRSRLKFAISMAFDFDIYLFDEINAVGDARFREKSMVALRERSGKSNYIMVSHNANELVKGCDVLVILHEGILEVYDDITKGINYYRQKIVNA
jgi:capsular polysaccharide transport system ATP-binding protein